MWSYSRRGTRHKRIPFRCYAAKFRSPRSACKALPNTLKVLLTDAEDSPSWTAEAAEGADSGDPGKEIDMAAVRIEFPPQEALAVPDFAVPPLEDIVAPEHGVGLEVCGLLLASVI